MSKSKATKNTSEINKYKHLALEDRIIIESNLNASALFKDIALQIGKDSGTISKEVKRNRTKKDPNPFNGINNQCGKVTTCQKTKLCNACRSCVPFCRNCKTFNCNNICSDFKIISCPKTERAPYVCNSCDKRKQCRRQSKYYYYASHAQTRYRSMLCTSREGINITEDELALLDSLISPLLKKGQSLNHIYANHKNEIPCSKKTLYEYIDQRLLSVGNLDLPRKVRYKKRKKHQIENAKDQRYRVGRNYKDFLEFIAQNPELSIVEMDTVEGLKSESKVLLTLLFRSCNCMLIYLLNSQTQKLICNVFDRLELDLGYETFAKMFQIILTDNGSEFKDPKALETSLDGRKRTQLFYCEPNASWQKGRLEKNHEFIRYVLPKGTSFEGLTHDQVFLLRDHINSFSRDSLNENSPMDLAELLLPQEAIKILNLRRIHPDSIMLTPHLLK